MLNYDSTVYRWHCKLQVAAYSRGSGLRILIRLMFRLQWWKSLITSAKRSFSNKHSPIDPLLASSPELEGFKAISRNAPSQGRVNIPSCEMVASFSIVLDPRIQTSMLGRSVVAPHIANIITRGSNHPLRVPRTGEKAVTVAKIIALKPLYQSCTYFIISTVFISFSGTCNLPPVAFPQAVSSSQSSAP